MAHRTQHAVVCAKPNSGLSVRTWGSLLTFLFLNVWLGMIQSFLVFESQAFAADGILLTASDLTAIDSARQQETAASASARDFQPAFNSASVGVSGTPPNSTTPPPADHAPQLRHRTDEDESAFLTADPPALWLNSLDSLRCSEYEPPSIGGTTCEGLEAWQRASDGSQGVFFAALGDTGDLSEGLYQVTEQLAAVCSAVPVSFISLLGDNFYPAGVKDNQDPKFITHFEKPFSHASLMRVAFFPIFGNHDYRAHPQAQVQRYYSLCRGCKQPQDWNSARVRWRFPNPWYYTRLVYTNVPLDLSASPTAATIKELQERQKAPPDSERARFMVVVNIHLDSNLFFRSSLYTAKQMDFLEQVLRAAAADADWVFVHQHHPLFTDATLARNIKTYQDLLLPVYLRYGVDAVFAGHEHLLSQFELNGQDSDSGPVVQVVSGAGSKLHREEPKCCNHGLSKKCKKDDLPCPSKTCVFQETLHGFTLVEFSLSQMRLSFVNAATGEILNHAVYASKKAARFSKAAPLGGPVGFTTAYPPITRVSIPLDLTGGLMSQHPWITWLPLVLVLVMAALCVSWWRRCRPVQRLISKRGFRLCWKCWLPTRQPYSELVELSQSVEAPQASDEGRTTADATPALAITLEPVGICELRKQKVEDDASLV
ncbi:hypothetical protein ACSSS7_002292 [Eimeria intestinalis]